MILFWLKDNNTGRQQNIKLALWKGSNFNFMLNNFLRNSIFAIDIRFIQTFNLSHFARSRRLRLNVIQNYFSFLFVHQEFLRSNIRIKSFMIYMWCVETWSQQKVFFAQKSNKRSQKAKRRRNWNSKLLFPASSRHSIGAAAALCKIMLRMPLAFHRTNMTWRAGKKMSLNKRQKWRNE